MKLHPDIEAKIVHTSDCRCVTCRGAPAPVEPPAPGCDEKTFQAAVVKLAKSLGWEPDLIYHTRDSRGSQSGFPDLVMIRGRRLLVAELKIVPNKATAAQTRWLRAFEGAGVESYLWYADQWKTILEVLR